MNKPQYITDLFMNATLRDKPALVRCILSWAELAAKVGFKAAINLN